MSMHFLAPKCRVRRGPPRITVLSNKIKKARVEHTLRCGCTLHAGDIYHEVVALVEGQFKITKQHTNGCIETVH